MNNEEFQVLIGGLLGDGCITIPTGCKNAIYEEPKKLSDKEYLEWKAKILQRFDPKFCYADSYIKLYTRVHPELTELGRRWYPNGKKIVVFDDVEKLDALGLAIWYQNDGFYVPSSRVCEICNGFSPKEGEMLRERFQKKWGLSPGLRLHVSKHELYFCGARRRKFLEIVGLFIHPCMKRKTATPENLEKYRKYLKNLAEGAESDIIVIPNIELKFSNKGKNIVKHIVKKCSNERRYITKNIKRNIKKCIVCTI